MPNARQDRRIAEMPFTFGIEEEYYLVDIESRDLATDVPNALIAALEANLGDRFSTEYMRAQIEVATSVCRSSAEARRELKRLRRAIVELARPYGLAPLAASTHPFARWSQQSHNDTPRYNAIAETLQGLGRRMLIGGLHVHVGIEDEAARIAVMNDVRPYLPILLALSASSPFWQGESTGLASYRTAINDSTPRKGIPETFTSVGHYNRDVAKLVKSGVIEDATQIWWDIRPSTRYPTLEMRITDICPTLEDGLCLAAIFRCLCRYLMRTQRHAGQRVHAPLLLINENRWRAQRYGITEGLVDQRAGRIAPYARVVSDLLARIRLDAEALECQREVERARRIVAGGTSADRQLSLYSRARKDGASHRTALVRVVDELLDETNPGSSVVLAPMRRRRSIARAGKSPTQASP